MVYDERSNFIGDTHWKGSEFDEGEEFELERGHILVDVGECIGKKDQDLSELVDKRVKEKEDRAAVRAGQATPNRPQAGIPASEYLRPKTLYAVIGTPTGHYGRAMISNMSPFEEKHKNRDENTPRPTKRRKQDDLRSSKSGYAQNLMGATLTFSSSRPACTAAIRYEPIRPTIQRTEANTIDLTNDEDDKGRTINKRSPARIQKRKPRRSPPAKSGYASNLMGAVLNLGSSSREYGLPRANSISNQLGMPDYASPSPEIDRQSIRRSSPPSDIEVSLPKRREEKRPMAAPDKNPTPRTQMSKPQRPVTKEPLISGIPDRPISTLRIKARAPRKMMMLMDLPSSRTPMNSGSSSKEVVSTERPLRNDTTRSQDIIEVSGNQDLVAAVEESEISQSKVQKSPFPQAKRPTINAEDMSSSPIDSGIDHQTIDALLLRRRDSSGVQSSLGSEKKTETQAVVTQMIIESEPKLGGLSTENMVTEKDKAAEPPTIQEPMSRENVVFGKDKATDPPIHDVASMERVPPKLTNPASRGQSIRILAPKTLETIPPEATTMQPPRIIDRLNNELPRSRGVGQPMNDGQADLGPWSRESFDLFGSWRPPQAGGTVTG